MQHKNRPSNRGKHRAKQRKPKGTVEGLKTRKSAHRMGTQNCEQSITRTAIVDQNTLRLHQKRPKQPEADSIREMRQMLRFSYSFNTCALPTVWPFASYNSLCSCLILVPQTGFSNIAGRRERKRETGGYHVSYHVCVDMPRDGIRKSAPWDYEQKNGRMQKVGSTGVTTNRPIRSEYPNRRITPSIQFQDRSSGSIKTTRHIRCFCGQHKS